jgi:hypothetical protein
MWPADVERCDPSDACGHRRTWTFITMRRPPATARRRGIYIAGRLAIINLISAYSAQVDTFNLDAWFALFTDDAVFVVREGKKEFGLTGTTYSSSRQTTPHTRLVLGC